ncbi:hypothetical protein RRV45_21320 [Bacillus sp. DTU_2020_1000418_1_SI_GHA_SEK_038]|uniref:hypothetical protein n=1 Tax=Bacillus sp. DTU_2020_1000418_1_SI_GHA_SEK_038 TaxID=3077585 RepID=UPI0028EAA583|nr:hypothetical protein [Bacillus sp. DTU_2020_1000418_1_SI_GHA_SEK_038]WNS75375.1 hypothetical protein RRV45_21320 [Bacillus sp. DTU_2020_1000418_1_SI_GHA_SEK_038]
MEKSKSGTIKRGQAISFRVPSDTPDHLLKHLQKLKETERRNFSSKMAEFVLEGVGKSYSQERETITIPLPQRLSKSQRDWLKHEHSEALIGNIIYQLLIDPVRSTSLLASMNSKSVDINEALYLQEGPEISNVDEEKANLSTYEQESAAALEEAMDDDLMAFDWETAKENQEPDRVDETPETDFDLDDLLGDFLAKMNK